MPPVGTTLAGRRDVGEHRLRASRRSSISRSAGTRYPPDRSVEEDPRPVDPRGLEVPRSVLPSKEYTGSKQGGPSIRPSLPFRTSPFRPFRGGPSQKSKVKSQNAK